MNAAETLLDLARRGIDLRLDDGRLRARAPRGRLGDEDRATIERERNAIVITLVIVAETVENVSREPADVFDAWRREIVAWQRWAEAGRQSDPHQAIDVLALRHFVPFGRCLACGANTVCAGDSWCPPCQTSQSKASA